MNNFEKTKSKISKVEESLTKAEDKFALLKTQPPIIKSLYYIKNQPTYIIDSYKGELNNSAAAQYYTINLYKFPEHLLPFIKILPIISSNTLYASKIANFSTEWEHNIYIRFLRYPIDGTSDYTYTMELYIYIDADDNSIGNKPMQVDISIKLFLNIPNDYDKVGE